MTRKDIIAEFAMEIALPPSILKDIEEKMGLYAAMRAAMSTSVGGIGPLLRERIIAQAELGLDVIGITLLYEKVWVQRWHAWGQFYLEKGDSAVYIKPLLKKLSNKISVSMPDGTDIKVNVFYAEYGKGKVYFLDAPQITNIVYPGPEDAPVDVDDAQKWAANARIMQSWLLGRGGLEILRAQGIKPDTIVLSETPTLFGYHDLFSDEISKSELFKDTKYVFNDHTPLEYAHPVWSEKLLTELGVKSKYYKKLESYKSDSNKVDITQLLVDICDGVYGVSKLHGNVMKNMHTLQTYADKIETITNGVSRDIWQADSFKDYKKLKDDELLAAKQKEKDALIDWMWHRYKFSSQWREKKKDSPLVLWMRRVTGYKRLDILKEIVTHTDTRYRFAGLGITMLIGGRIHQNDAHSDWVVFELLDIIQKYPELEDCLILLDNFNVWEAPILYRGVDAGIMISDKGREASATGFMKAQMNGGMIIATEDGAVPESVSISNGFFVEYQDGHPTVNGLLGALEQFKRVYDNKEERVKAIRSALSQSKEIDVNRTAKEMLELYSRLRKKEKKDPAQVFSSK